MPNVSFLEKIKSNSLENVFFVKGEDFGLECWYYVEVPKIAHSMFLKECQLGEKFDLAKYGKIIISGWGKEPSSEIKEKVESGDFKFQEPGDGYKMFHFESTDADGDEFFAFLAVPEPLAEKFHYLATSEGKKFNMYEYGEVLKWGWGKAIQQDFDDFEQEFGFKLESDLLPVS